MLLFGFVFAKYFVHVVLLHVYVNIEIWQMCNYRYNDSNNDGNYAIMNYDNNDDNDENKYS